MRFNAFDIIEPSMDDMKQLLFPFSMKRWMKLGFISMMEGLGRGGSYGGSGTNTGQDNKITGQAIGTAKESFGMWSYLILPTIILFVGIGLLITYITSIFGFIFIEALDTKKVQIKKGWHKNKDIGFSYFLFRIAAGLLLLGVSILLGLPILIPIFQQGLVAYFQNFSVANLGWIIPAILLFVLLLLLFVIFMALVYNFSMVHMYFKKMQAWQSIKTTFSKMRNAKLEVFVFLLAKLAITTVQGIAGLLLLILLLVPFGILALPFIALFWGLVISIGWTAPVIAGAVLTGIVYLLLLFYAFSVIFLPISTFARYFSIQNYHKLME